MKKGLSEDDENFLSVFVGRKVTSGEFLQIIEESKENDTLIDDLYDLTFLIKPTEVEKKYPFSEHPFKVIDYPLKREVFLLGLAFYIRLCEHDEVLKNKINFMSLNPDECGDDHENMCGLDIIWSHHYISITNHQFILGFKDEPYIYDDYTVIFTFEKVLSEVYQKMEEEK